MKGHYLVRGTDGDRWEGAPSTDRTCEDLYWLSNGTAEHRLPEEEGFHIPDRKETPCFLFLSKQEARGFIQRVSAKLPSENSPPGNLSSHHTGTQMCPNVCTLSLFARSSRIMLGCAHTARSAVRSEGLCFLSILPSRGQSS